MHLPTDKDKLLELEKYRISMRHLAAMMGKNPDEFTFEDQQKAIRYLMPGKLNDPKPTGAWGEVVFFNR